MSKLIVGKILTILILITVLVLTGMPAGCDKGNGNTDLEAGKGRVSGYVTDNEELLSPGAEVQKYEGVKIQVLKAVASGTYKQSEDSPEMTSYTTGDLVTEIESVKDGYWQADLAPGNYYIRAFWGTQSYTGDIYIEIQAGKTSNLDLELIHGV